MENFFLLILSIIGGSILYTFQEALKYIMSSDKTFIISIWVETNWKTWMYSLIGSILGASIYTYMPGIKSLLEMNLNVTFTGEVSSFLVIGSILGAIIKSRVKYK